MARALVVFAIIGIATYMLISAENYPPEARYLPQLLASVTIIFGVLGLAQAVPAIWRERGGSAQPQQRAGPRWRAVGVGVAFVLLIAAYISSIRWLGYLVATPLMLFLPLAILRPVGPVGIAATVLSVTGMIWVLFIWFLELPVPLFPSV
ncbi:tripartite tricarboxylate transporter TctB family protein [Nitratireductor sp. PBL-C9]|uniref:tripartite tricarboxylate transporter TctB family protein n=1 Tax=Nitratireductor sp. PBL-C9 TaxID=3435013 RepID=UPI003D7CF77D